jgi:hypothetical protein
MKTRLFILAVIVSVASTGCSPRHSVTVDGPGGASSGTELLIYELVVRNLLADEPVDEVILVSFGESWIDHVDPPDVFFQRLSDLDVELQPVSQHEQPANANALLLAVHVTEWTTETQAIVAVSRFRFGVGASESFTATAEWGDGVWKLVKTTGHWSN